MKIPSLRNAIRWDSPVSAVIILIGIALRLWRLGGNLYADEVWFIIAARSDR